MALQTIGQKIKYFRERAGISQLDLELAVDASTGSISRMENDKVNPTKETLLAIANRLNLSVKERADLIGVISLFPTSDEVTSARQEVYSHLQDEKVYAYLLDEWADLYDVSKGLVKLFNIPSNLLPRLLGKNLYELVFDPSLGIRKYLDEAHINDTLITDLARLKQEVDYEGKRPELLARLKKLPNFIEVWEAASNPNVRLFDANAKASYLKINGQKLKFSFSQEQLKSNPRFVLVEYTNPQTY